MLTVDWTFEVPAIKPKRPLIDRFRRADPPPPRGEMIVGQAQVNDLNEAADAFRTAMREAHGSTWTPDHAQGAAWIVNCMVREGPPALAETGEWQIRVGGYVVRVSTAPAR
ncbi:hypothetical protein O7599_27810 [Streptomyces sp. WMMC500]|uniref:hypothetical protein n=1 Tax=Streptomyces sp. WMMC500 TaxID=3015154 RepID=UPI00248B4274|nr:hypothetical protein [Streptomyces sp. WMMC500]WBB59352.1 hypothetical protein O7599_27810 [Streptomyces sp. WMMC500]